MKQHFKNLCGIFFALNLFFGFIGCDNDSISNEPIKDLVITEKLTNDSIYGIAAVLKSDETKVNLDLSNATGLTEISDDAFMNCKNLVSIKLPAGIERIGLSAFENCSALKKISIPKTLKEIDLFTFLGCVKLSFEIEAENQNYISSDDGKILISKDKKTLICYPSAKGNVIIPDGIQIIGIDAFYGCSEMETVIIPDSVTTIQDAAFYLCTGLTKINISKNVEKINSIVFSECEKLIFEVAAENEYYASSDDGKMLFSKDKKTLICYPSASGDIEIPGGVEIIGENAFESCLNLINVKIPNSVLIIEGGAFEECSSLTTLTIPQNVLKIGTFAFNKCTGLKSITFEDTETWYKTLDYISYTKGEIIDVSNPEENANILPKLYDVFELEGEKYPIPYCLYKE